MSDMKRRKGFTLVEMLAVMAVIAVLAAMILGISGLAARKSDEARAKADIEQIKNLLDKYRAQHGVYPDENEWDDIIEEMDKSFFIDTEELNDPWGTTYNYEKEGKYLISVYSSGLDGNPNTYQDNVGQKNR